MKALGNHLRKPLCLLASVCTWIWKKRWFRRCFWASVALLLGLFTLLGLAWVCPLPQRLFATDSTVVEFADGTPAHVFLSPDSKWRIGMAPSDVDPAYLTALLRLEDKRFYSHHGIDPIAMVRAVFLFVKKGRIVSGGSTLTMQVARVLEPQNRSLSAKLRQIFRALQLELRYDKTQILAQYLRFAPFGNNLEGIEAASLSYFGHRASTLSAAEIAVLLAIPQDPNHRIPTPEHLPLLKKARDQILHRLYREHALPLGPKQAQLSTQEALQLALGQPIPTQAAPLPRLHLHAAYWLLGHSSALKRNRLPTPESKPQRISTTLDAGIGRTLEQVVAAYQPQAFAQDVHNVAVVVIENRTAQVKAMVGNFNFWDQDHGGQIAGFSVPRSPGSTLKPLLYAMALDRGMILPGFLVSDVPMQFGSYLPHNYSKHYQGLVRIEDALSQSLNLPFIKLLNDVGASEFLTLLQKGGIHSLRKDPGYYGLSAMVGGIELTPIEIAGLYTILASDGIYRPLRFLQTEPASQETTLFSKGAVFLTKQALSKRDRPDFPNRSHFSKSSLGIYWKTGTSFGHRDAWAVGFNDTYTVAVWMGNFNNRPSASLVGSELPGPLLFDILMALPKDTTSSKPSPPEFATIKTCAYSGYPASPDCPSTQEALALPHHVPLTPCPYHKRLTVDIKTGMLVPSSCQLSYPTESKLFLVYPPAVRRFLNDQGRPTPPLPRTVPNCTSASLQRPPQIIFPPVGHKILLIPGLSPSSQAVPFTAESADSAQLHWFVDGAFLGTHLTEQKVFWTPSPGDHEIVVTDEAGNSAKRMLSVLNAR